MATSVITGSSGTAGTKVVVTLNTATARRLDDGSAVTQVVTATADGAGAWTATLEDNSNISPANSYWTAVEEIPGAPRTWTFVIGPDDALLADQLVAVLPSIPPVPAVGAGHLGSAHPHPALNGTYASLTTRRSPIMLGTAGGENTNNTVADATWRYPFRIPVATTRWRLHVRNFNSRSNTAYTGAISFTGAWVGTHALTALGAQTGNFTAAPVSALGAFATPADGSEYTSGWVTDPLAQFSPYTEHLLSVGWTCAGGQTNMRSSSYGWWNTTSAQAGDQTPATTVGAITVGVFDVWIECEYLMSNQLVVGYHGDSLTTGYASGRPVYSSYPVQHALGHSNMAVLDSYTGTTLAEAVASFTQYRWTKFTLGGAVTLDASLVHLGGNDIFNGDAVATVQANLQAFINGLRTIYGVKAVYLATIMPRNNVAVEETHRQTYNTWLRTLPCNAIGLFDFDAAVRDPTSGNILPAYNSGDNVHLTISGYNAMARAVTVPLRRAA